MTENVRKDEINKFIAGSIGGGVGILTIHPLDTIRIRIQTNPLNNDFFSVLKTTMKNESTRGLYKGLLSPVLGEMGISCMVFGTYGLIKENIDENSYTQLALAGGITGVLATFVVTPVELIKVRIQINPQDVKHPSYNGFSRTIKDIVKRDGSRGLYRGFSATMLREIPMTGFYFVTYELMKRALSTKDQSFWRDVMSATVSGGCAGMASWLSCYPFDMVKNIIQASPEKLSIMQATRKIYQCNGIMGFTRALAPTLVRAFPESAATFLAYELMLKFLSRE